MGVVRNPGARWFIPTESEWYKAAYYQPAAEGGDSDNFWSYPMKTNSEPYSDQPPGATPDNTRVGNFFADDFTANGYNDGFAVTGALYSSTENYLTDVGAYTTSPSYYGTFDQGGNVFEWNEAVISPNTRGTRGGYWRNFSDGLSASYRHFGSAALAGSEQGLRVASIPEPAGLTVCLVGMAIFMLRRLRK
jgi:formylglycine-generating enzyme required for sulfatase activity